ncbi:hypothetical protein [Pleomorphovibrio marinus]|uniref:hypothetical protein n=1 Tax=Pleomorphovibrio marinus TaxID=2164132 RepID=UPI00130048D1|nr:hypothetical protein [Pleomorphovibrio marinus]
MYAPIPIKANSSARVMILDNYRGEIAYYHSNLFPEWVPLEERILQKHIQILFKGYYW